MCVCFVLKKILVDSTFTNENHLLTKKGTKSKESIACYPGSSKLCFFGEHKAVTINTKINMHKVVAITIPKRRAGGGHFSQNQVPVKTATKTKNIITIWQRVKLLWISNNHHL